MTFFTCDLWILPRHGSVAVFFPFNLFFFFHFSSICTAHYKPRQRSCFEGPCTYISAWTRTNKPHKITGISPCTVALRHWPWRTCFNKNIHLSEKDNTRETRLNQIKIFFFFKLELQLPWQEETSKLEYSLPFSVSLENL